MPRRPTSFLAYAVALAVALPATPAFARYSISCNSNGMRYQYCAANTEGFVRLTSVQSQRSCNQGRDWGYDGGGVWVSNGCRATFEVGRGGGGGSSGNNDAGAALAVAGGLAILGAMIANSNSNSNNNNNYNNNNDNHDHWANGPDVPGWMIGRFSGRNSGNGQWETISIDPHGNAWLQIPGGARISGTAGGNSLAFQNFSRSIQPARGGIVVDGAFYNRS